MAKKPPMQVGNIPISALQNFVGGGINPAASRGSPYANIPGSKQPGDPGYFAPVSQGQWHPAADFRNTPRGQEHMALEAQRRQAKEAAMAALTPEQRAANKATFQSKHPQGLLAQVDMMQSSNAQQYESSYNDYANKVAQGYMSQEQMNSSLAAMQSDMNKQIQEFTTKNNLDLSKPAGMSVTGYQPSMSASTQKLMDQYWAVTNSGRATPEWQMEQMKKVYQDAEANPSKPQAVGYDLASEQAALKATQEGRAWVGLPPLTAANSGGFSADSFGAAATPGQGTGFAQWQIDKNAALQGNSNNFGVAGGKWYDGTGPSTSRANPVGPLGSAGNPGAGQGGMPPAASGGYGYQAGDMFKSSNPQATQSVAGALAGQPVASGGQTAASNQFGSGIALPQASPSSQAIAGFANLPAQTPGAPAYTPVPIPGVTPSATQSVAGALQQTGTPIGPRKRFPTPPVTGRG